ncbi:MAG: GNAT family N-acetyltransferase [Chloroflexi bacterium]|nr:GNAT family N-acetyltransferase [Chloroflexota bacterium]
MAAIKYVSPMTSLPDGFEFRNPVMQDAKAVTDLLNIRVESDYGAATLRSEQVRAEWLTPGFHPSFDARLVFDTRGRLVGYVETWTTHHCPEPWVWGCVHPNYEGRGVGTVLLKWAEVRIMTELYVLEPGVRFAPRTLPSAVRPQVTALYRNLGWSALAQAAGSLQNGIMSLYQKAVSTNPRKVYEKELRPAQLKAF